MAVSPRMAPVNLGVESTGSNLLVDEFTVGCETARLLFPGMDKSVAACAQGDEIFLRVFAEPTARTNVVHLED